jgi:hypothetical protein
MKILKTSLLLLATTEGLKFTARISASFSFNSNLQKPFEKPLNSPSEMHLSAFLGSNIFLNKKEDSEKLFLVTKLIIFALEGISVCLGGIYLILVYCYQRLAPPEVKKFFNSSVSDVKNLFKIKNKESEDQNIEISSPALDSYYEKSKDSVFLNSVAGSAIFWTSILERPKKWLKTKDYQTRNLMQKISTKISTLFPDETNAPECQDKFLQEQPPERSFSGENDD